MADYRIDDLARAAGTTVRNVRAYQDRGLLPPPRREGRVAWYGDAHLARLRILTDLLARGYTQANIAELLAASDRRQEVGELIVAVGGEPVLSGPWSEEREVTLPVGELIERFGAPSAETIQRAIELGIFGVAEGGEVRVKSQRLLAAGTALVKVGVALDAILDALVAVRAELDRLALVMVDLVADAVVRSAGLTDGAPPTAEHMRSAAEQIRVLRHEAEAVVQLELTRALEHRTRERVAELVRRALGAAPPKEPG